MCMALNIMAATHIAMYGFAHFSFISFCSTPRNVSSSPIPVNTPTISMVAISAGMVFIARSCLVASAAASSCALIHSSTPDINWGKCKPSFHDTMRFSAGSIVIIANVTHIICLADGRVVRLRYLKGVVVISRAVMSGAATNSTNPCRANVINNSVCCGSVVNIFEAIVTKADAMINITASTKMKVSTRVFMLVEKKLYFIFQFSVFIIVTAVYRRVKSN